MTTPSDLALLMRLDLLAYRASEALRAADIPHALIKGPTTATWLYDPPRIYRDVDLLIPARALDDAVSALTRSGVANPAGRLGEEGAHSQVLTTDLGLELDLHVTLPMLQPGAGDAARWDVFSSHVEDFPIEGLGSIPAFDIPARCFVLALHAVAGGDSSDQPLEDLRRARTAAAPSQWEAARALARKVRAEPFFDAGLALVEAPQGAESLPVEARLKRAHAVGPAFGLQRLAAGTFRERVRAGWNLLLPSSAVMARAGRVVPGEHFGLLRAHVRRWGRLLGILPIAIRQWRAARRAAGSVSRRSARS